jgi:hypothetical protein
MITFVWWHGVLIAYCAIAYVVGWNWFRPFSSTIRTLSIIELVFWLLSPVVLPIGLLLLFIAG